MDYTTDYFREKFTAIEEDRFIAGRLMSLEDPSLACAGGHCYSFEQRKKAADEIKEFGCVRTGYESQEREALDRMFLNAGLSVSEVNDRPSALFPQTTPKQRILAALGYIEKRRVL